jgi:glycosyltransferase involved in cell wall biosynthesis
LQRVLTVARLEANKRPWDFVKVAELVNKKVDMEFVWIGHGTLLKNFSTLGKPYIKFTGKLGEREKSDFMRSSNVYVSTSEMEGFNVTIGEALLHGLIVIAYDLPVYRSIYKDTIIYVPLGDVERMADSVIYYFHHRQLCVERIRRGKELVRANYSSEAVGRAVENFLTKILSG